MKWVILSTSYSNIKVDKRYLKVEHTLKKVSGRNILFLFSSIDREQVSVFAILPIDYTIEEYKSAVRNNNARLKEKMK